MAAMTPTQRFERKIRKTDGCWFWQGMLSQTGKPQSSHNTTARKRAYELYVGEVPAGKCVQHSCEESLCVNPGHLFLSDSRSVTKEKTGEKPADEQTDDRPSRDAIGYHVRQEDWLVDALIKYRGVDWDETRTERLTTTLHWPWPAGNPIPYDDGIYHVPDTLARPKIFRSLIVSRPIDRTARRVACNGDSTACPYCKRWFRNPAALALHIEESHHLDAKYVWSDTQLGIAYEARAEARRDVEGY